MILESIAAHKKKLEGIVRELISLTKGHHIFWQETTRHGARTYHTEYKDMQIELRDWGYTLEVDSLEITVKRGEVSLELLEELDSAIQEKLHPHTGSFSSRTSPEQHVNSILERLNIKA